MKTVQSVKNSLKFKAQEKDGALSIRIGVRKYDLPISVRMLSNGDYLFLSFPASSELYRTDGKELSPMGKDEDANDAFDVLNPGKKTRKRRSSVDLPKELAEALGRIPNGYKLGYNLDGTPKLVRARKRSKN